MSRRARLSSLVLLTLVAALLGSASPAAAEIAPPWCGTPEPDAAEALPSTGTSFPHIPVYAIGCTLADIQSRSLDGRMSLEVHGTSANGRPMYKVVINQLQTDAQQASFDHWTTLRKQARSNPAAAQRQLRGWGDRVKVPLYVQGSDPRQRVRGRGREHAHDRAPRHDAVRHRSRRGRDPRRRRRHLQRDPEPGRPRRRHARERQRLRPQPRLPHPVAVGDEGLGPDHAGVAAAGDARPARLRHADADRGDDEAAQPGDRLRPLAEVEPVAHRRERGGAERRQPQRHSPDQRLVLRRQHLGTGRPLPGRPAGRSGGRRELGRLGPVLHADVLAARRPQRLDRRDVQQHEHGVEPARPLLPERRPGPGEEPDRP